MLKALARIENDDSVKFLDETEYLLSNQANKEVLMLEETGFLPPTYSPHKLSGNYSGYMEAHIKPAWLIIWKFKIDENEIWLTRTGTRSDLF